MVTIRKEFDTREDAETWRSRYLESYHPAGYSTYLCEPFKDDRTGKWVVSGSRGSSAD